MARCTPKVLTGPAGAGPPPEEKGISGDFFQEMRSGFQDGARLPHAVKYQKRFRLLKRPRDRAGTPGGFSEICRDPDPCNEPEDHEEDDQQEYGIPSRGLEVLEGCTRFSLSRSARHYHDPTLSATLDGMNDKSTPDMCSSLTLSGARVRIIREIIRKIPRIRRVKMVRHKGIFRH